MKNQAVLTFMFLLINTIIVSCDPSRSTYELEKTKSTKPTDLSTTLNTSTYETTTPSEEPTSTGEPTETPIYIPLETISIDNVEHLQLLKQLNIPAKTHYEQISDLDLSPSGDLIGVASETGDIYIWNIPIFEAILSFDEIFQYTLRRNNGSVSSIDFSPDKYSIASSGGLIRYRRSGEVIWQANTEAKGRVEYNHDGSQIAIAGYDEVTSQQVIEIWSVVDKELITTLRDHPTNEPICDLAYSPDGSALAAGYCDFNMMAWNAAKNYEPIGRVIGIYAFVPCHMCCCWHNQIEFLPDNRTIASATTRHRFPLVDIYTNRKVIIISTAREITKVHPDTGESFPEVIEPWAWDISFSPDGELVAIAAEQDFQVRSVSNGDLLYAQQIDGIMDLEVVFSSDGSYIAVRVDDSTILILGIESDSP